MKTKSIVLAAVAFSAVCLLSVSAILVVAGLEADKEYKSQKGFQTFSDCKELKSNIADYSYGYPVPFDLKMRQEVSSKPVSSMDVGSFTTTTNLQVEGVEESDYTKVIGDKLFYVTQENISVLDLETMKEVGRIDLDFSFPQIFAADTRIIAIGSGTRPAASLGGSGYTVVSVFDSASYKETDTFAISGAYQSSRLVDGQLTIVTNTYLDANSEVETQLPVLEKNGRLESLTSCDQVRAYAGKSNNLTVVYQYDTSSQQDNNSVYLGNTTNVYMNKGFLYLVAPYSSTASGCSGPECELQSESLLRIINPFPQSDSSKIIKISIDNNLEFVGGNSVPGGVLNQFALDEFQGNLRVAFTDTASRLRQAASVQVFDKNMEKIGEISGLAPGENIYAVRFAEDTAYVVTFLQVDPLFVIDLSDPTNPKLDGELKIPGFSSYLHPVGKGRLLGVGSENSETDGSSLVKVSLFDVTNPRSPKELDSLKLGSKYAYSPVQNDHRYFSYDAEYKNAFIPIQSEGNNFLAVVDVSKDKLSLKSRLSVHTTYSTYSKAVVVGDHVYSVLVSQGTAQIDKLNRDNLRKVQTAVITIGLAVDRNLVAPTELLFSD